MRSASISLVTTGLSLFGTMACSSYETSGRTLAVSTKSRNSAPVAQVVPHKITTHGHTRVDSYYWMRDDLRESQDVLDYLKAENDYLAQQTAHTEALQEALFQELSARIKPDDTSVPVKYGQYEYWTEYKEGLEYPIYKRRGFDSSDDETARVQTVARDGTGRSAGGLLIGAVAFNRG